MVDKRRVEAAAFRPGQGYVSHRWRFLPVGDKEIDQLSEEDVVGLHAQMKIVQQDGLKAARHLDEDIYEVEAHGIDNSYRLLFSSEGTGVPQLERERVPMPRSARAQGESLT